MGLIVTFANFAYWPFISRRSLNYYSSRGLLFMLLYSIVLHYIISYYIISYYIILYYIILD